MSEKTGAPPPWLGWVLLVSWIGAFGLVMWMQVSTRGKVPGEVPISPSLPPTLTSTRVTTPTPSPTATPALPLRIEPYDPDEVNLAEVTFLYHWIRMPDLREPGRWRYPGLLRLPVSLPIVMRLGWCAKTKAILEENERAIRYRLVIEGQEVPIEKYFRYDKSDSCFGYEGILYPQPGLAYAFTKIMEIREDINDGWADYARGEYRFEFTLQTIPPVEATQYAQACRAWVPAPLPASWREVYCDDMNGDFQWWSIGPVERPLWRGERYFKNGVLIWRIDNSAGVVSWDYPNVAVFTDTFLFSFDFDLVQGNPAQARVELLLENFEENTTVYHFAVRDDGEYRLHWYDPTSGSGDGRAWTAITLQRGFNNLAVLVRKGEATFFINGQPVETQTLAGPWWIPALGISVDEGATATFAFDRVVYALPY